MLIDDTSANAATQSPGKVGMKRMAGLSLTDLQKKNRYKYELYKVQAEHRRKKL